MNGWEKYQARRARVYEAWERKRRTFRRKMDRKYNQPTKGGGILRSIRRLLRAISRLIGTN